MKKILLCCAAGMSTSLLVTKMQEYANKEGIESKIWAVSVDELQINLDQGVDVVLLGPQIRYKLQTVKGICEPKNIPTDIIDSIAYGSMNGKKVVDFALKLMK